MNTIEISLDDGILVAALPNGETLESADAIVLASLLVKAGFQSEDISHIDWHSDMDRSPSSGQKIAIHEYLRNHSNPS
ncbi:hypothetical protein [Herminiimonas fonticola]|uniref:Uncharacterized protein n=1 Tax=Herminiimonas fonticola TaxID=303380 RepID=A0A4R6GKA1_9BURK|nr:hypothetical protein [Herminiimonas fonticola]RBA25502.1 hypothetical protein Hfont_1135 [Herminiimonas fonticola]TDN94615.1 hypothetical protein EV677_1166 [Herminiimonas fonticola]